MRKGKLYSLTAGLPAPMPMKIALAGNWWDCASWFVTGGASSKLKEFFYKGFNIERTSCPQLPSPVR